MSYQDIAAGTTERFFTVVQKANGNPIVSGVVNYYLKAKSGTNDGKWWRDSDQTWQATQTANPMTHEDDGHWEIDLTTSPFTVGDRFLEFLKETGDLHIPDSRHLIGAVSSTSTGSRSVTVTVKDTGASPIQNAEVQIRDAGTNVLIDTKLTDSLGVAVLHANDGSYNVDTAASLYASDRTALVVDEDEVLPITLTLLPAPSTPGVGLLTIRCFDEFGDLEPNAVIYSKLTAPPPGESGNAYDSRTVRTVADGSGIAEISYFQLATYQIKRGDGEWATYVMPALTTHEIDSFVGVEEPV